MFRYVTYYNAALQQMGISFVLFIKSICFYFFPQLAVAPTLKTTDLAYTDYHHSDYLFYFHNYFLLINK